VLAASRLCAEHSETAAECFVGETPCVNQKLTCPNLEAAMARGEFTEVYHRLNGVEIRVRPLLERRDEITNL
jgi:hypothetical protein